jgi:putative DNA primase/helicase
VTNHQDNTTDGTPTNAAEPLLDTPKNDFVAAESTARLAREAIGEGVVFEYVPDTPELRRRNSAILAARQEERKMRWREIKTKADATDNKRLAGFARNAVEGILKDVEDVQNGPFWSVTLYLKAGQLAGWYELGFGYDNESDAKAALLVAAAPWNGTEEKRARDDHIDNGWARPITPKIPVEILEHRNAPPASGIRAELPKTKPQGGTMLRAVPEPDDSQEVADPNADDDIRAFKFPDGQRPTDVGNANRLLVQAGERIRYVHAWGKWIVYQDGRWIVDEKDALVTEKAKQVPKSLYKLAAETAETDPEEAKDIWKWAMKSDTSSHIAAMVRLARGVPGLLVNHEDLDADPWTLNCTNGTVDLRTGQLRSHDPADLCTLQVPVDYDPHATAPLWETCLKTWQPDPDVRDYIQLRAGAGATGIPTETVDIDYSGGGNGKSKFHGAIQHVLVPYTTVPHKSLLVSGRFEQHPTVVAALFRRRLAVASETKAAESLNDEQVKNLTGGDRLEGRRMREDPWEFWPTHTLIMFSNHKPAVQGRDEGIWRRLRLVPWTVTIPDDERDDSLALKLQAEAPGILRWIVDGAKRFHADGGFRPPEVVRAATDQYRKDEDIVGRFVREVLEFDPHTFCYSCDIKAELDAWCDENDIEAPPRMNEIAATLVEKGASNRGRHMIHGKRSTRWSGVCVTQNGAVTP